MNLVFQFALLLLVWTQANMIGVVGWHVWRIDMCEGTMVVEATVYEPQYKVPLDAPDAYYTVSSFNSLGDTFAIK